MEPRRWLDEREQEAWRHLVAVLLRLPGAIEQQLQRDAGLAHIEYLVLALLSEADARRLRLSHLAGQANVSLSRLSHVITRLERRGWLVREPDPDDARASRAVLTDLGHAEVVAAAPGHVDLVRSLVFEPLTDDQIAALGPLCEAILGRIDPERGPVGSRTREGSAGGGAGVTTAASAEPLVDVEATSEARATPGAAVGRAEAAALCPPGATEGSRPPPEPQPRLEVEAQVEAWSQPTLEVGGPAPHDGSRPQDGP